MKLFNLFGKEKRNNSNTYITSYSDALSFGNILNRNAALNISAVYRAVEIISDAIAILPVKVNIRNIDHKEVIDEHPIYNALIENETMSKYTLIKLLVQSVLLKGNGFAYIQRSNDGTVIGIRYLDASDVVVNYNKVTNELYYTCTTINKTSRIEPINMLHFVKNSNDGINGISVLKYAARTLENANNTENSANNFFGNGCNLSGVLTVQGQLTEKQKQDIRSSWNQAYSNGGNGLAVLQGNMSYQPIQLSAADSQMLESRIYNIQDIARFFGISPVLLGDLSHTSYSTIEATQNQFLLHTLQPYISMIEDELNRKLLKPSESNLIINLDETAILKTDKTALASYYSTLLDKGVLCVNEVRKELGYSNIEGGDKHLIAYTKVADNTISTQENNNETNTDIKNENK